MSKKKLVPGFIWLTPRESQIKHEDDGERECTYSTKPPMLVAVSHISGVVSHERNLDTNDIACSVVMIGYVAEECYEVIETVEEIAELIRREWQERTVTTAIAGS